MNHDHTAAIGFAGTLATLTLGDAHLIAGLCVAFVTVGYVGSKWFFLIRDRRRARR